ncbi:MAG: hypothetical protein IID33_07480 [Planctomycetes bacterium]|nr:hypothetical protein [Planctomycetota bacterium]
MSYVSAAPIDLVAQARALGQSEEAITKDRKRKADRTASEKLRLFAVIYVATLSTAALVATAFVFDLSGVDAVISYARWYSNTQGNAPMQDTFVVAVSNDDGNTYQTVEIVGPAGPEVDGGWFTHRFVVSNFVEPTSQVRVRFSASDVDPQSVVEAGIDAFRLEIIECASAPGPGDMNCDLEVNAFDIEPFILAIFDPPAYEQQYPDCDINLGDINGDGAVDAFDIEGFLNLLFP